MNSGTYKQNLLANLKSWRTWLNITLVTPGLAYWYICWHIKLWWLLTGVLGLLWGMYYPRDSFTDTYLKNWIGHLHSYTAFYVAIFIITDFIPQRTFVLVMVLFGILLILGTAHAFILKERFNKKYGDGEV